ncbi:MAG: flagellin [Methanoregula sp.]|nr:flagellin [Methanoregula sp.]
MCNEQYNEEGFTGLEAAIMLLVFIVISPVFFYGVPGAGCFTIQKAQETEYRRMEQLATRHQLAGNMFGLSTLPIISVTEFFS